MEEHLGSNTDGGQYQKGPRLFQKTSSLETIYEIHFQGQERDRDPNLLFVLSTQIDWNKVILLLLLEISLIQQVLTKDLLAFFFFFNYLNIC